MANGGIVIDENPMPKRLAELAVKLPAIIGTTMDYWEPRVQSYARRNAPWTDRTGNARQGLFARHNKTGGTHRITVYHTMPYGIWLEVRHSGRYQIIMPTVRAMGPEVMRSIQGILGRIG